jgi:hypothetical protein
MPRYEEERGYGDRGYGPRAGEPLEQRLDRWVSAGRQLVDGVSGVRPGSRAGSRESVRPRGPTQLGRWVEERLDWLLDDSDDWREPWQQGESPPPRRDPAPPRRRRSLEALSRRGRAVPPAAEPSASPAGDQADWPDEESFSVPRWQRAEPARLPMQDLAAPPPPPPASSGRPLPRSSRRRS